MKPVAATDPNPPPTQQCTPALTVAQIARAIGVKPQSARERLAGLARDGFTVQDARPVSTWYFCSLPDTLRADLLSKSRAAGFDDVIEFIQSASLGASGQSTSKSPQASI